MALIVYSPEIELSQLKPGDVLALRHVSDLGRSWSAFNALIERGVTFRVKQSSRQPDEPLEVWVKRDLRRVASDRAHARGCYRTCTGRPRKGDASLAAKLAADGIGTAQIAGILGVSTRTIARYLQRKETAAA